MAVQAAVEQEAAASPALTMSGYIAQAQAAYNAKEPALAIASLDNCLAAYPQGSDELWWLYGQIHEAAGAERNIKKAIDDYRRLLSEYPQSAHYTEARRRLAYLERYYVNIR
jgi:outer membrane protein assembly factor BamD (BamD/ComL family)